MYELSTGDSYYIKATAEGIAKGKVNDVSGDINIVAFITNYVDITFE